VTTGASSSTSSSEVGRVGRPHGLDGSFHVTRPRGLAAGPILVDGEPRVIERLAGTPERPIVRLAGSSSRADAEALRGASLSVPESLEEGEYRASDLEGCRVVDGDREIGAVARMVALPSCEALEVDGLLIPMVRDAIRSIDVEARRIDVDMGFVDA
jgi:16S rRNA processing protein RimM